MNTIKTIIANTPFYFGYAIVLFGNKFVNLGYYLHKKLKTETGKKITETEEALKDFQEQLKSLETLNKAKKYNSFYLSDEDGNA